MAKEVCSPVSIKGSKVGSGPPMSPSARTNPSRASLDSVPEQLRNAPTARHSEPEPKQQLEGDARRGKKPAPGSARMFGPEE